MPNRDVFTQELYKRGVVDENGVPLGGQSSGGGSAGSLKNAAKLRRALSALAQASYRRVNIGWLSMSLGVGYGAEDGTPGNSLTSMRVYQKKGMIPVAGARLNAALVGDASARGLGINPVAVTADGNVSGWYTLAGGAVLGGQYNDVGIDGRYVVLTASASTTAMSFTVLGQPAGTVVRVYSRFSGVAPTGQYALSGNNTVARTDVSTAATTAEPTPLGTAYWYEYTITLPAASDTTTGTTVTLYGSSGATGSIAVYAVEFDYKTTPGITMHRLACSGRNLYQVCPSAIDNTDSIAGMSSWTGSANATKRTSVMDSLVKRTGLDFVMAGFDVNDIMAYSTRTLADWTRHITNFCADMDSRGLPVVFVLGTLRDPALYTGSAYTQDDVIAAYKSVAAGYSRMGWIDLTEEYTGTTSQRYASQIADPGMFVSDLLHESSIGHGYYGGRTAQALLAAAIG